MSVKIIHNGSERHLLYIARVSSDQEKTDPGLISWLIRHSHWSPFEMIGACVEINTTRDIGRQMLRHRSFCFQEFSQRYAEVREVEDIIRQMRLKGGSNRQGSLTGRDLSSEELTAIAAQHALDDYKALLECGIAPECARAILPEGFTPTRLYMNGTLRSWIHYLRERLALNPEGRPWAQLEHYWIAARVFHLLSSVFPATFEAINRLQYIDFPKEDFS